MCVCVCVCVRGCVYIRTTNRNIYTLKKKKYIYMLMYLEQMSIY